MDGKISGAAIEIERIARARIHIVIHSIKTEGLADLARGEGYSVLRRPIIESQHILGIILTLPPGDEASGCRRTGSADAVTADAIDRGNIGFTEGVVEDLHFVQEPRETPAPELIARHTVSADLKIVDFGKIR